ncbi:hypothetical protein Pmani_013815 [Petrolisthes manimaculis]|uniref:Uncharacterized protein n=1 Tax=Petrolisthes manimaculis TaxID=1843537 RepID=A0AAE1PXP2_9EUCA|nr:hypothetical protein Pmani_013815 [Petrolisthes manimaculis]
MSQEGERLAAKSAMTAATLANSHASHHRVTITTEPHMTHTAARLELGLGLELSAWPAHNTTPRHTHPPCRNLCLTPYPSSPPTMDSIHQSSFPPFLPSCIPLLLHPPPAGTYMFPSLPLLQLHS